MTSKTIKLSKRLQTIASFVESGSRVADIGTDHAYIPVWLVQQQVAAHAIAMDIGAGPLRRAQEHIESYGLSGRIETRLSDGLAGLNPGEADTIVIAGMGGALMLRIVAAGSHVRDQVRRWIFSPQSELEEFRRGIGALGLAISDETMLCEDGKFYHVIVAGDGPVDDLEDYRYRYGDCLIRRRHPVLLDYLKKEKQALGGILKQLDGQQTAAARMRRQEIETALRQAEEAYDAMQ